MLLFFVIIAQWLSDNHEAKYYCPPPGKFEICAESTHAYDVLKYELNVTVPMTNRSISGVNHIACRSRVNNLTYITVHRYNFTIDSVRVDGTTCTYSTGGDSMVINLPHAYNMNDSFYVMIGYHGSWNVTSSQTGFCFYPRNYNANTRHAIAYTLGEPWDARGWMPCYDEPFDKADYGCEIIVTAPDSYTVCSNGELINVVTNPGNTKTWTWQENYPITTYLMHFGVSRFSVWSNYYYSPSGDTVENRNFVWPEDSAQSVIACQCIPWALALFDSMYGPYPFGRYGQDVVYPYAWGGMEHQELSTIHRNWILNVDEDGMAHELAHQWWGDMITCVDFRDIWLNEGFATYSDANYSWWRLGHGEFLTIMDSRAQDYFAADASNRRPLYDPPLNQIFNWGYTYCKACWAVHMLRYIDEINYFPAVHAYRDSFEYSTASTEDIKSVFSAMYGTDLTWFFDEWVYGQGYPDYRVYWVCNPSGGDYLFRTNIYQVQTNAPPVFHMPVQIMLHKNGGDTLVNIGVTASPQYAQFLVSDSVTSITFDPNFYILKKHQIFVGLEELISDQFVPDRLFITNNPGRNPLLSYFLNRTQRVELCLYDAVGRKCMTIFDGRKNTGLHYQPVSAPSAGVYFCCLKTENANDIKKIVVVK